MDKTGTVITVAGIGALFVWSGINNKGVLATTRDIIAGTRPVAGPQQRFGFSLSGSSSNSDTGGTTTTQGDTLTVVRPGDTQASVAATNAVGFAVAQVGKPYVWGATGPDGYDCSGLVYTAYNSTGIKIPRVSEMQMFFGTKIPLGSEIPGDLMFPEPGHVVMCIGGGQVVEAPHTGLNVRVRPYSESEFVMVRRVA